MCKGACGLFEHIEHLPVAKAKAAVLTGGRIAIATWCQRETTPSTPLTDQDKSNLQYLYDEWAHPFFVSKEEYGRMVQVRNRI